MHMTVELYGPIHKNYYYKVVSYELILNNVNIPRVLYCLMHQEDIDAQTRVIGLLHDPDRSPNATQRNSVRSLLHHRLSMRRSFQLQAIKPFNNQKNHSSLSGTATSHATCNVHVVLIEISPNKLYNNLRNACWFHKSTI